MSSFNRHSDVRFGRLMREICWKILEIYVLGMVVLLVVLAIERTLNKYGAI
jgi:hypothetical protein